LLFFIGSFGNGIFSESDSQYSIEVEGEGYRDRRSQMFSGQAAAINLNSRLPEN
jgi:hypothetical protein